LPYISEHAARIKSPSLFKDGDKEWARKEVTSGISIIFGHLKKPTKGSKPNTTTVQAYRFDKTKFTVEQARQWLTDHKVKIILFEPANDKGEQMSNNVEEIKQMTLQKLNEYNKSHGADGRFASGGAGGGGGAVAGTKKKGGVVGVSIGLKSADGKELKQGDKVKIIKGNSWERARSPIVTGRTSNGQVIMLTTGSEKGGRITQPPSNLRSTGRRNLFYAEKPKGYMT